VAPGAVLSEDRVETAPQAPPTRLPRTVVVAHAATLVVAFSTWAYLDRDLWFFGDEWDFLTRRGLHGAYFSLWAPHNEHWSVLPILLWRAIYSLEHLSSYWPYLVPLLLAHVAVVHLVWRRCLREGADPWVATALALLLGLLGAGAEDLVWAFQIGFVSSLLFGLLAMEVVEGAGYPVVRGAAAACLGLAALMCSTVGVASCVALAVLLLGRSGWRRAVTVLAVPLSVYAFWFALAGHSGLKATGDNFGVPVFLSVPVFVASNLANDLGHVASWPNAGAFLAAAVIAWGLRGRRRLFARHPAVLGGGCAAVVFYALAATGRDRISPTISPSRYAYVGAVFLLPALALMLTDVRDVAARWRPARGSTGAPGSQWTMAVVPVMVLLVAAATAGNVIAGVRFARSRTDYVRGLEDQIITSAALLQNADQVPRALNRYPVWASGSASGYLTPYVLARLYRDRLLPRPGAALMTPTELLNDLSWLDLAGSSHPSGRGRFQVLSSIGVTWSRMAPAQGRRQREIPPPGSANLLGARDFDPDIDGAAMDDRRSVPLDAWPRGPGSCALAVPAEAHFPLTFPASARLGLAAGARAGSLWVSLGKAGGKVLALLARPWGTEGLPGSEAVQGQALTVPASGHLWLNDFAPGDDLVLQLPPGRSAEVCGLSPANGNVA
jgi:hypothetical protein